MEPSFWSWEKHPTQAMPHPLRPVAMEPSFWSWEKIEAHGTLYMVSPGRNGAQLLELGKASTSTEPTGQESCRNGAQLLELGKAGSGSRDL